MRTKVIERPNDIMSRTGIQISFRFSSLSRFIKITEYATIMPRLQYKSTDRRDSYVFISIFADLHCFNEREISISPLGESQSYKNQRIYLAQHMIRVNEMEGKLLFLPLSKYEHKITFFHEKKKKKCLEQRNIIYFR